jgi:dolichyl-phosphate-mannose--protein O-mannosyl transferase
MESQSLATQQQQQQQQQQKGAPAGNDVAWINGGDLGQSEPYDRVQGYSYGYNLRNSVNGNSQQLPAADGLCVAQISNANLKSATQIEQVLHQQEQNALYLRSGDKITLFHQNTGRYLHSHPLKYAKGSKQQEVVCCAQGDCFENQWEVRKVEQQKAQDSASPSKNTPENPHLEHQGKVIMNRDYIVLKHDRTNTNLFASEGCVAPVTEEQQEVCCNPDLSNFSGSVFQVRVCDDFRVRPLLNNERVYVCQAASYNTLHSHNIEYRPRRQFNEVTLYRHRDNNDIWLLQVQQGLPEKLYRELTVKPMKYICNDQYIRLLHVETFSLLTASDKNYKAGSKQKEVYGKTQLATQQESPSTGKSKDEWCVKVAYRSFDEQSDEGTPDSAIRNGDLVYFVNVATHELLSSRKGI